MLSYNDVKLVGRGNRPALIYLHCFLTTLEHFLPVDKHPLRLHTPVQRVVVEKGGVGILIVPIILLARLCNK